MSITQLNPEQTEMLIDVVKVILILAVTYFVAKIFSKALSKAFEKTPFPEGIERGIVRISKYIIYIIGLFVLVSVFGVDLTSLILGLGAFSIAISFATSTLIQNMVSGIIVLGEKALEIGDIIQVRVGGKEYLGKVIKIGIRSTVIETEENNIVFLPNSLFLSTPVVKIGRKSSEKTAA